MFLIVGRCALRLYFCVLAPPGLPDQWDRSWTAEQLASWLCERHHLDPTDAALLQANKVSGAAFTRLASKPDDAKTKWLSRLNLSLGGEMILEDVLML